MAYAWPAERARIGDRIMDYAGMWILGAAGAATGAAGLAGAAWIMEVTIGIQTNPAAFSF
jgi:hypothetical protein